MKIPTIALCLAALAGCGKEVGRVPFAGEGVADASATLKAGDVAFWTDIDIEYTGEGSLAYHIDLVQGGATVATATCNPLGRITTKGDAWTETNLGGKHTRQGSGEMTCSATLASGGATTVKATLSFGHKPPTVSLKKADLVVKQ